MGSTAWGETALRMPLPSGLAEAGAPETDPSISFHAVQEELGGITDMQATFSASGVPPFTVARVTVNGEEKKPFYVRNRSVFNGNADVHGIDSFSVAFYEGWKPGTAYRVVVEGTTQKGKPFEVAQAATSPESRSAIKSLRMGLPTADMPCHTIEMVLAKESLRPGKMIRVEVDGLRVDGKFTNDARYYNQGPRDPAAETEAEGLEGETHTGEIDGGRDFRVIAPCAWTNGSKHTMRLTVQYDDGKEEVFEQETGAPGNGGYWNEKWPYYASIVLRETAGLARKGEPVHLCLGLFADEIRNPEAEIRIVTYFPEHPDAGPDGYIIAPCQVTGVAEWRDEKLLSTVEKDAETGEVVHRYDPTTTVDLVFLADVLPYEERVYQVVYGNPEAEPLEFKTDLSVKQETDPYAQAITTKLFQFTTAAGSGAVETITVLGEGEPVLLEHKLETNGAVHWNPGCYAPPLPWVHVSDWDKPALSQISGPIMHRTQRHADLPHMKSVRADIVYEFYAGQPYVLMESLMEVRKEIFVKALRNGEIVFNHAVLDEFVWMDPLGTVQSLPIEGTREHPIHALEIPANTPWMALVNREQKVGFASIALAYENTNLLGDLPSEAQPYFYVQNGPWVYISRPLVYPFGGQNLTRVMRVRQGSLHLEKNAWVPFRFADGDDPFAEVKCIAEELTHPLLIHEWMPVNERTPEQWVMPILTMPFDEGVAGAVSAHKAKKEGEQE